MGSAIEPDQPGTRTPVQSPEEADNSEEFASLDGFTPDVERPATLQPTEGLLRSLLPRLVVAVAETADGAGNFDVGVLSADGSILHAARLNKLDVEHRMDTTFDLDDPALGAFEVRVAIRPLRPHQEQPTAENLDDYGYGDYR